MEHDDIYPCRGHECYDAGNFHASCTSCPLYGNETEDVFIIGVDLANGTDFTSNEPILTACEKVR